jgi:hypothetical protein
MQMGIMLAVFTTAEERDSAAKEADKETNGVELLYVGELSPTLQGQITARRSVIIFKAWSPMAPLTMMQKGAGTCGPL